MSTPDVKDDLAEQLARFHISAGMQRVADEMEQYQQLSTSIADGGSKRAASGYSASNRIGVIGQGPPQPGCRPVWEPPIFDYAYFEKILEAQKKFAMEEGCQDIAFRTDVMDHYVEIQISLIHGDWVSEQIHKYEDGRSAMFFSRTWMALSRRTSGKYTGIQSRRGMDEIGLMGTPL